jgi:hypothetical protein
VAYFFIISILILVVNLAKYAGPAACYPPTRQVCDQLFDAADSNQSGGIDREEFVKILRITSAQILSRILVYYLVLILLVPFLASLVVDRMQIPNGSYQEMAAEQTIGLALFFCIIPIVWNHIDSYSEKQLVKRKRMTERFEQQLISELKQKDAEVSKDE